MPSNGETNIHQLWHEQPREEQLMSLSEIRAKAQRFETKTRRWRNIGTVAVMVAVIANAVQVVWPGRGVIERTGDLLTIAAFVYIWLEYRKHGRRASMPEGLGLTGSVDFFRAQLTYERNLTGQSRRFLLPFVPGVSLSLLAGVFENYSTSRLIGVAAFGVALFLGVAWVNARTARKLQREIDAL